MASILKRSPLNDDIDAMARTHHGSWKNYQEVQLKETVRLADDRWSLLSETQQNRQKIIKLMHSDNDNK